MSKKIDTSEFSIDQNAIPEEVSEKIKSLSLNTRSMVEKIYGSSYDFFIFLYHLWFIEKLEKSEIAEKLGVQSENIHIHLYNLSWYYSNDYIENQKYFERDYVSTKALLEEAKKEAMQLDENDPEHKTLRNALNKSDNLRKSSYKKLGFTSKEEYTRVLYYMIEAQNIAPIKLIPIFNQSYGVIQKKLRSLGLNVTQEKGIARKTKRKSQNYEKSLRSGKKTRAKAQLANFSTGSKNQDYVRIQLSNFIYDYINSSRYECIVGMSNTGILGTLEIDIPLVIYDRNTQKTYRFAIEYNGDYFHTADEDINKKNIATEKGWNYMSIQETSSMRYSNNQKLLDQHVFNLCKKIKESIV